MIDNKFGVGLIVSLLLILAPLNHHVEAQTVDTGLDEKLEKFLNDNPELRRHYQCRFTGRFATISEPIKQKLDAAFPDHEFRIALMDVIIDLPPKEYQLIVVTKRRSGDVFGFVWQGMWALPSESFQKLVYGESLQSPDKAINMANAFAELLASTGPLAIGRTLVAENHVKVEILTENGNSVFRTVQLDVRRGDQLGKFIIRKQDGKRIK